MLSARFRPPWWATVLVLLLSAGMISLGSWQLHRGQAKQALRATYEAALRAPEQSPEHLSPARADGVQRLKLHGHYEAGQQLLLDNQGHEGRPGYHLWTPLRTAQGELVMVDRGWIPREARSQAEQAPVPDAPLSVQGYWRNLPVPGMRLAADNCQAQADWPRLVQYPTLADLQCLYPQQALADGLLLLDAAADAGFVRDWQTAPELDPAKHWGYAFQWFAFTLTLWVLYLRLNWRRAS